MRRNHIFVILGVGVGLTFLGLVLIPLPGPGALLVGVGLAVLLVGGVLWTTRTMSSRSETPDGAQGYRPYLVVALLFWAAPVVLLLFGYLVAPAHNSSGCEGLGFGCSPSPKDSILLVAIFGYPSLVVAGLLIMGVIAATQAWRRRSR
jgi:hypothetical protein